MSAALASWFVTFCRGLTWCGKLPCGKVDYCIIVCNTRCLQRTSFKCRSPRATNSSKLSATFAIPYGSSYIPRILPQCSPLFMTANISEPLLNSAKGIQSFETYFDSGFSGQLNSIPPIISLFISSSRSFHISIYFIISSRFMKLYGTNHSFQGIASSYFFR